MFTLLRAKSGFDSDYNNEQVLDWNQAILRSVLVGALLLTGCEQSPTTEEVESEPKVVKTDEQLLEEDNKSVPQSDSAAAHIEQLQPIYVEQLQGLQRRLQAEYDSLLAADGIADEGSLLTAGTDNTNQPTTTEIDEVNEPVPDNDTSIERDTNEVVINTSTEVGERDLTVLKRISLEPRKPTVLTEVQIIDDYQQAIKALYQPVTRPLSAQETDTLLNIATLLPQLFEHAEIANRVNAKSPALARLIIQQQVWAQIEEQQVLDMQQMKQEQQREFESLMTKFNDTIEDYDKQIAKYEQTLQEFR